MSPVPSRPATGPASVASQVQKTESSVVPAATTQQQSFMPYDTQANASGPVATLANHANRSTNMERLSMLAELQNPATTSLNSNVVAPRPKYPVQYNNLLPAAQNGPYNHPTGNLNRQAVVGNMAQKVAQLKNYLFQNYDLHQLVAVHRLLAAQSARQAVPDLASSPVVAGA
ncbi:hypothetical protein AMATHDRAFT_71691, partial [Amanita thiersii Skay4041]